MMDLSVLLQIFDFNHDEIRRTYGHRLVRLNKANHIRFPSSDRSLIFFSMVRISYPWAKKIHAVGYSIK